MKKFNNPIISGFYPDPSICRVGDDYYLVNSSFEYFPAIPVWHSKDLVNWKQIANAIDREEQGLDLSNVSISGGVQACTIRHYNGTYYITSTCVGKEWPRLDYNFIITAKDPKGPWSKVHYIEDAPGIDSSLFFDNDGTCYFHANRSVSAPDHDGDTEIWAQVIDLDTFELIGEKHSLWKGYGGHFPEGPHIYYRNGYYYLLVAEGGTLHWHTVTLARSEKVMGPYTASPRNPLLTHKNIHRSYPIQNVGHGDLVETQNGDWYMVCLGSRPRGGFYDGGNTKYSFGGYYRNLGRETFLVPVVWEDDIGPLVSPITGRVEESFPFPNLDEHKFLPDSNVSHFNNDKLELFFNTIRNERINFYSLTDRPGYLRLKMLPGSIYKDELVSFLGRRQTSWHFTASTKVEVDFKGEGEEAGITCYLSYRSHIRFTFAYENGKTIIKLISHFINKDDAIREISNYYDGDKLLGEVAIDTHIIYLKVHAYDQDYKFYYSLDNKDWTNLGGIIDGRVLSADLSDLHTGTYIAMYASANGNTSDNYADFDYFEYIDL